MTAMQTSPPASARFDAVLFDAGGVLVLPDPTVIAPLLAFYGGDASFGAHHRAHYAGMCAKSLADEAEGEWLVYDDAYVDATDVREADRGEAARVLNQTRTADLWRWPIADTRTALDRMATAGVPMGVVSNASGQIEASLNRTTCQVGPGPHVAMRCIIDSDVVGVAKPDPAIFDHALEHFGDVDLGRIAYVGDSVTMDIASAGAAGLHPILLDPYNDHEGAVFERIRSVTELADELCAEFDSATSDL